MSEDNEKTKKNISELVAIILAILLTAAIVGGGVWYYMNQNDVAQQKSYNDSVSAQNKQIAALNNKILGSQNKPATDNLSTLRQFCTKENNQIQVSNLSYMETGNGIYGNCSVGGEGGGGMVISMLGNGGWASIWQGNGVIEKSTCDQYKIPNKMSGGTCNY